MASKRKLKHKHLRKLASGPAKGCDVSSYQGVIDWKTLSGNAEFVIIRATDGAHFVDKYFATNWQAARDNNIPRGAYHFFRPTQDIDEQVQNFVSAVGALKSDDLGVVLDLEAPENWATIEESKRVGLAVQWLDGVEQALGVTPMIYLSPNFVAGTLGAAAAPVLAKYPLWIANYNVSQPTIPSPWSTYVFWQYSDTGRLSGINGDVDLDVASATSLADMQSHVKKNRKTKSEIKRQSKKKKKAAKKSDKHECSTHKCKQHKQSDKHTHSHKHECSQH
ncbi:MAG TPA: glycoside hydrolase family 25 protein [Planktothrix sp.]|jgi:lysozyme